MTFNAAAQAFFAPRDAKGNTQKDPFVTKANVRAARLQPSRAESLSAIDGLDSNT
jgi:hypothetical protein